MTPQEIATAYREGAKDPRRTNPELRIQKAKLMAQRFKVDWKQVEPLIKAHESAQFTPAPGVVEALKSLPMTEHRS